MILFEIFKNTNYSEMLFTEQEIEAINRRIIVKQVRGKDTPYITCLVREKDIKLTPEEAVRQLYVHRLLNTYGYPKSRLQMEYPVHFGRDVKRADIVIFDKDRPTVPYIIVEVKKSKLKDGKEQLKSYCNATGAPIAVWTNGEHISTYNRRDPNYFEPITDIPNNQQTLSDVINEKVTYEDLKQRDKIANERRSLRSLIEEMEDEVLANAGVDSFEEVFKLIFTKLYDELTASRDKNYALRFRNTGDTDAELKSKIEDLFDSAKRKWNGIFADGDRIVLTPSHLSICVSTLQDIKLFNSNLDVVDDAFEYLMSKSSKGEKGQYFTPRYVIDMCVKMMNPKESEKVIDTAAGSAGFTVHSIFHVWDRIAQEEGRPKSEGFTTAQRTEREVSFVRDNVFAIDFDEKAVRVARTLNLIAGDGQTNVLHLNTLDYGRWDEVISQRAWRRSYNEGFNRLLDLRPRRTAENDYSYFSFDLLMANPPFAGDIKESTILARYEFGKNDKGKMQTRVGRDILFIERNLNFLKPGGRMAIVLPQGRFNNSSDKRIRDFIAERCRILAVVGLHGNVFKPHTGTKTSVLFVQKWDDELCPKRDDYPIFFATMQKPSKDNSGDKIYVIKDTERGLPFIDPHGHLIVDHDLYNHEGLTQDGIAEAFIEFAKKEDLSFFGNARPFDAEHYDALMSGLEASEVSSSKFRDVGRLDAEYYKKEYLRIEALSHQFGVKTINKINCKLDCSAFYPSVAKCYNFDFIGIPFLRVNDIYNGMVRVNSNTAFLPPEVIKENSSTIAVAYPGDIVIAKGGNTLAKVGIIGDEYSCYATCRDLITVRTDKVCGVNKYFLWAYLHSKYGQSLLWHSASQTGQPHLTLPSIRSMFIPDYKEAFQILFEANYINASKLLHRSITAYSDAETLLLETLGLRDFSAEPGAIQVKSFSESFGTSGRLDAEYYQGKFDRLFEKLALLETDMLGKLVSIKKSIEPGSDFYGDEGLPFVRISDITKFGITEPEIKIPANLTDLRPRKDTILLSKDGSVGIAYKVEKDMDFITSGALLHLTVKDKRVLPDYLTLVLNSKVVQLQAECDAGGSIIKHWKPSEIANVVIPIIDIKIQDKIVAQIKQSFSHRSKSKQLLEMAKHAVEIAIEDGEEVATEWLNAKLNSSMG